MKQKLFITTLLCSLFCYISSMAAPIERDIVINHDGGVAAWHAHPARQR